MIALGLDTTGGYCTAALVKPSHVLASSSENIGRGHAERLAPMVQDILQSAHVTADQIDLISVCTGPGSFTGLRVALSFAKGFALPRKIPVIGVSAHQVWAAGADPEAQHKIICVSDVRRGELCWSVISKGALVKGPVTEATETARTRIAAIKSDAIVEDQVINGSILAWLGLQLDADTHLPVPLYSRPADAKLPGGKTPPPMPV